MDIKNTSKAKQGVTVGGRTLWIDPGKTIKGQAPDEHELARLNKLSGIEVSGQAPKKESDKPIPEKAVDESPADDGDKFDAMSEDELREYIEAESGEKAHWKAGREKLLEIARNA